MSGNGNDGTVYGATLGEDRNGEAGKAYEFDGVNDWIEVENDESFNFDWNDSFTISAWVKPYQLSNNYSPKSIIEKWSESGGYPFVLRAYENSGDKIIGFGRYDGTSSVGVKIKNDNLLSDFGHVIAVSVGMKVAIYYNGVQQDSEDFSLNNTTNNSKLFFGKRGPNLEFFNGSIDDVRIYDRGFSSAEILELYNLEKPKIPLNDSNFQTAVDMWFTNEANATATFGHISDWNTSAVTDMSYAFENRTSFNENIAYWDTSSVTSMKYMFSGATSFNQPIGGWNVSSVGNMRDMFNSASSFNQDLGDWNTSSVSTMLWMFNAASSFNQDISNWDVSSVLNIICSKVLILSIRK